MTTWLIYYSFLETNCSYSGPACIHILTKLAFDVQQSFALFGIYNSDFFALSEKNTF